LPGSIDTAQVCDATEDDSSNAAGEKIKATFQMIVTLARQGF
jgi:hypothetical protein